MSQTLIIAEKPSVATDLARVLGKHLGKFKKNDSLFCYENESYIITSAVGHLVEQQKPMTEEGKSLPWKMDYLPAMPAKMTLEPITKSADRLRKVLSLARKKSVTALVNACDAGREGELIFRNIVRYGKVKKPISRLWMQSMTDDAIMEAWGQLLSDQSMQNLADAAVCRSESDWLVGLNSTRALTVLQSAAGGFHITPTGRVQTPTLAILAKRQKEILAFIPEPYQEVRATFAATAGSYAAKWYDPQWKKNELAPLRTKERIWDPAFAAEVVARCQGKPAEVTEKRKPVSVPPPLLFDLTSLQKEASNRYGYSARRTLQLAQECYEKHKVLTYPRTDSKYLPEDYIKIAYRTVGQLRDSLADYSAVASNILDNKLIKPSKRVFDSSKVSDHFAIIPTGRVVALTGDVAKIYTLVVQRFLGIFLPAAQFEDTERTTIVTNANSKDYFHSHGRVLKSEGWRVLLNSNANSNRPKKEELCPIKEGETVTTQEIESHELMTKPPASYTEATLLSAMEGAGKLVEDEELASAMKERGLGTPATRASIIEGLITQEYIARDSRELIATRHGMDLIDLLGKIGLSTLSSPEMTGDWEYRLKLMEQGKLERDSFMVDIRKYTTDIVDCVRTYMNSGDYPDLEAACPACHQVGLGSRIDAVSCKNPECKFRLRRAHAGLGLSDELLIELISKKELPIMDGFRSRFGKPFRAGLRLYEGPRAWRVEFIFEESKENKEADANLASLGMMPVLDQGELEVFESDRQWTVPEFSQGKNGRKGISLSRTILSKVLELENLQQLLLTGKTELIKGFVSQRTRKAFDAFLVVEADKGKVGFEFPPREPRNKKVAEIRFTKEAAAAADLEKAKSHGKIKVKGKAKIQELLESEKAWHVPGLLYGKTNPKPLSIAHELNGVNLNLALITTLLTESKTPLLMGGKKHKKGFYITFAPRTGKVSITLPESD